MESEDKKELPDMQNNGDSRGIAINKVGVKGLKYPVRVRDRSRKDDQHRVANFNMYVNLPHNFKGTHMSRFVEILNMHEDEISVKSFQKIVTQITQRLEADSGYIEMTFPYFIKKAAPVSRKKSFMDYEVTFIGELRKRIYSMTIKVAVPVTSLCPCSKEISEHGAHNQRSIVTIYAKLKDHVWIEELIELVEKESSCELYGLLKRPDEKYVTEHAYNNPKFVEDTVRDIAGELNKDDRIISYRVESENFESIHNHSAFGMIESDKFKEFQGG